MLTFTWHVLLKHAVKVRREGSSLVSDLFFLAIKHLGA